MELEANGQGQSIGEEKGVKLVSFSVALVAVKDRARITRKGWNGKGMCVKAQYPDELSKMNLPYLYIEYAQDHSLTHGMRCPWLASQTDIMAEDWEILPSEA